jgi:hypothetical protein
MRRHISYANVAATLALVFSMGGAAVAAQHYLITSTSQISPRVLAQLRGRKGPRGPHGRRGPRGRRGPPGERGLQGRYGPRGPVGAGGAAGATGTSGTSSAGGAADPGLTGPTGPTGAAGQPQSALALDVDSKASNNVEFKPQSVRVLKTAELSVYFFCGSVPFAGNTLGGISVTGPAGGRAEMGLVVTNESGATPELQMPNLVRTIQLGIEPEEELAALLTNNNAPKKNEGYVHATITAPGEFVYIEGYLSVSPAAPECTLHGSAFTVPA